MKTEVKTEGQGQVFQSPILEAFTKTGPVISAFTYPPASAGLLLLAIMKFQLPVENSVMIFLGGLAFWTLFEYLMHRFVFHWVNEKPWVQKFHYMMHGVHHEYPKDEQRVFMPPVPGIIIISIMLGLSYLVMGYWAFAFIGGLVLGYCFYSFIHYSIHLTNVPKPLKPMWRHHSLHHFKYEDKAFGVSNMFWDRVFGTMPPKQ